MSAKAHIVLAAGGTGGHMFPAASLARELMRRKYKVSIITDQRGLRYPGLLKGIDHQVVSSASLSGSGFMGKLEGLLGVFGGIFESARILRRGKVKMVVGFGGYPALPTLAAAWLLRKPYILHEQNSVLGRVNRLFAARSKVVAASFAHTHRVPARARGKTVVTGNPVRQEIAAIGAADYPKLTEDSMLRMLIIGGSQGARIFSDIVPQAISLLPASQRQRIQVTQQCRVEDIERVAKTYDAFGIHAEVSPFFKDIPGRLRWAHLVLARAGATTVAELTAAGRPAILVPITGAADDHQRINAEALAEGGGGWLISEAEFNAANLAKHLIRLSSRVEELKKAAEAALSLARPAATKSLADIVEQPLKKGRTGSRATAAPKRQPWRTSNKSKKRKERA
ncbi:MAG: undecaprenyldiphospho-muramoylpentapeptide beta-N-acetylglucosaminyltransferase [Sphingomonadales bacterium]